MVSVTGSGVKKEKATEEGRLHLYPLAWACPASGIQMCGPQ